jgi:hypothetical protein
MNPEYRPKIVRRKIPLQEYQYYLYDKGRETDFVDVPYAAWNKYFKAERRFLSLRGTIEAFIESNKPPHINLWLKYYDVAKDFFTSKAELEIYYYENKYETNNRPA